MKKIQNHCPEKIKLNLIEAIRQFTKHDNIYFFTNQGQFIVNRVSLINCNCCDEKRLALIGEEML